MIYQLEVTFHRTLKVQALEGQHQATANHLGCLENDQIDRQQNCLVVVSVAISIGGKHRAANTGDDVLLPCWH